MSTFPLTVAPFWKLSGAGAGLLGASAPVVATYAQGASNGSQPALANVLQADTSQKFRIGSHALFIDETYGEIEAIYLKGVASLAQYDAVHITDTGNGTPLSVVRLITTSDATMSGPMAVALSNPTASQYGWFAISGKVPVSSTGVVQDEDLAATGTAGQLGVANDTLATAGNIIGAIAKSAQDGPATGFTDVLLAYPSVIITD